MKKISYVSDFNISSLTQGKIKTENGEALIWKQLTFMLGRVSDTKFGQGKEGIDVILFVMKAKLEIENQAEMAKDRGFWLLEDDRAAALLEATKHPQNPYISEFAEGIMAMAEPILEMTDHVG